MKAVSLLQVKCSPGIWPSLPVWHGAVRQLRLGFFGWGFFWQCAVGQGAAREIQGEFLQEYRHLIPSSHSSLGFFVMSCFHRHMNNPIWKGSQQIIWSSLSREREPRCDYLAHSPVLSWMPPVRAPWSQIFVPLKAHGVFRAVFGWGYGTLS